MNDKNSNNQIDSGTIDGNVEFVHSQYSCILTSQVSVQFLCPTKLLITMKILEESAYLTENKCHFMYSLFTVFTFFYLILEDMSTNVRQFRFSCYI